MFSAIPTPKAAFGSPSRRKMCSEFSTTLPPTHGSEASAFASREPRPTRWPCSSRSRCGGESDNGGFHSGLDLLLRCAASLSGATHSQSTLIKSVARNRRALFRIAAPAHEAPRAREGAGLERFPARLFSELGTHATSGQAEGTFSGLHASVSLGFAVHDQRASRSRATNCSIEGCESP